MKFLRRYLDEKEPTLKNFAKVVWSLELRQFERPPLASISGAVRSLNAAQ